MMIDIHSHLIFGVDDGSSCLEESIRMIEAASKQNISTIIATPHFQNGIFDNNRVLERYEMILRTAADFNMDIKLGYEVFVDDGISDNICANKNINLNNSKYLLIEFPYSASFENIVRLVYKISSENITVVIAHPERNRKIIKNFNEFVKLIYGSNCQIQLDSGSITGVYGTLVKEFSCRLLKNKVVDYLASNAHCARDYMTLFPIAVQKIYKLCGEAYATKLLESNAHEIISAEGSAIDCGREIS